MKISYYQAGANGRPGVIAQPITLTWEELGQLLQARLTRHTCEPPGKACIHKLACDAWSPAELNSDRRSDSVVIACHALVYDLDGITQADLERLAESLIGRAYYLHSTHGHAPSEDKWHLRLVLQLAEPFSRGVMHAQTFAAHWRRRWEAEAQKLGIPVDEQTKDLSRLYFFPSIPEGSEFFWAEQEGAPTTITSAPATVREIKKHKAETVASLSLEAIRLALISGGKNEDRTNVKAMLAGGPLAEVGKQDPTAQSLAWKIASRAPEATNEQILVLFGPCLRNTEWSGPDAIEDWFIAKLERAREGVAAKRAEDRAREEEQVKMLTGVLPAPPGVEGTDWLQRLIDQGFRTSKDGEPLKLKSDGHVVMEVLKNSDPWRGVFRWNILNSRIEYTNPPIDLPKEDVDAALPLVVGWLSSNLGMQGLFDGTVFSRIHSIAVQNSYDPLVEYLESVEWDGVPRVDSLLSKYVPTADKSASGLDLTDYRAMVGRRWLLSAVARAFEPGCKADSMLIFSGFGGRRKSQFGEILGGEWQTTYGQAELGEKDSKLKLSQYWIVEIEELVAFDAKSKEAIKKDISERAASVRPSYGRVARLFKRRCVFYGTTNDAEFIPEDEGGYRRFWPVRVVKDIDLAGLASDRDQLWAEAVCIFKAAETCPECKGTRCKAHRWWFDKDESFPVDEIAEDSVTQDPMLQSIENWLLNKAIGTRPLFLRTAEIMTALGVPVAQMNRALEMRVGKALVKLGFSKTRKNLNGRLQNVYLTPKALLDAPPRTSANQGGIA